VCSENNDSVKVNNKSRGPEINERLPTTTMMNEDSSAAGGGGVKKFFQRLSQVSNCG